MRARWLQGIFGLALLGTVAWRGEAGSLLVVVGAEGEADYGPAFAEQVQAWERAGAAGGHRVTVIGLDEAIDPADRERLRLRLANEAQAGGDQLWVVLVGHGTFDGRQARFNLRGPDLAAEDLAEWLAPIHRPVVVINTASSSAPFLNALSVTNRVVMTATRSGFEQSYARFGEFLARCFVDAEADLDQDGQVSLLEAFVTAGNRVEEFYQTEGRLMTEHALLDDNGDGLGTPADWYRGVRVVKRSEQGGLPDGARAHQVHLVPSAEERGMSPEVRSQRDALVMEVIQLRERRGAMGEEAYYQVLEEVLLRLARLYHRAGEESASPAAGHENVPGSE